MRLLTRLPQSSASHAAHAYEATGDHRGHTDVCMASAGRGLVTHHKLNCCPGTEHLLDSETCTLDHDRPALCAFAASRHVVHSQCTSVYLQLSLGLLIQVTHSVKEPFVVFRLRDCDQGTQYCNHGRPQTPKAHPGRSHVCRRSQHWAAW